MENKANYGICMWAFMLLVSMFSLVGSTFAYDSVAQVYDNAYGQDGNNALINANFSLESFVQSNFTHSTTASNDRLYVTETGTYKVSYSCVWEAIGGSNVRRIYQNSVRVNGVTDVTPSESDVYIRGNDFGSQAGGHISSTSATLLVNLTNGDYLELRGGEDPADANNGETNTRDGCFLSAQKLNTRAIEVFDSTGGQNIQNQDVVVNLDRVYYNGDNTLFNLNSDRVNVSEAGWYKVSYTSCLTQVGGGSGSQRQSPQSWIRKNGNENISLSFSFAGYTRSNNNDRNRNCNRANTLINLSYGDYIELQTGIFARDTNQQVDTSANQGWLLVEKVEMDSSIISINNSGQQVDHNTPTAITFDQNDKIGNYVGHKGSETRTYFNKSGLYEITYNIGYEDSSTGDRVITCGILRKNNNEDLMPSKQCIYTRGLANARTGTVSTTALVNVSKDDFIEVVFNVSGEVGTNEYVQVQKGTTWLTVVKINETVKTNWENTSLHIGTIDLNLGNLTQSTNMKLQGEGSTNITILCDRGDCSRFTNNFTNGKDFSGLVELAGVDFTCRDDIVGNFSAIYNLTSNEDMTPSQLNVTCNVAQTYGNLGISLNTPLEGSTSIVFQNATFILNGTLSCTGTTGSICGNVSAYGRHNISGGFQNISTFTGFSPFWTASLQPQNCVLNNGESCTLQWLVNATGPIGTLHTVNINVTSNFTQIPVNTSGNTEINISGVPMGEVLWSASTLNLGNANLNLGNITGNANIIPGGNHTNVQVACSSGDCAMIVDNFIDGINLTDAIPSTVTFTCLDNQTGSYSASFIVNSTEDPSVSTITTSCNVLQTYGYLDVSLTYPPAPAALTKVKKDRSFDINATIVCQGTTGASCGDVSATSRYGEYNLALGDGSDGALTVTTQNRIINNYTYLTATESSGQTVLSVNDATEFSIGDEILIIQIQDGSGSGTAGNYEFANVSGTGAGTITVDSGISRTYGSGTFNTTSNSVTQIVRVPHYTDVTVSATGSITAPAWDGTTGGIVVFRAQGTLNTTGYINVSDKGFRGGDCNGCGNNAWGDQGEGTSGMGGTSTGSNGNGGGGGFGPGASGEAGGGGGYGTAGTGGTSENPSSGGSTIGSASLSRMYFGGGAGAGGDNNARTPFPQDVDGGGIALVYAEEMMNARVLATGERGIHGSSGTNGGVSGSGAGGTIWLNAISQTLVDVNASGGGAVNGYLTDVGGAGGDGRIRLDYLASSGSSTPSAGFTNSTFADTMQLISTVPATIPFASFTAQPLSCGLLFQGESCTQSWRINATGFVDVTYDVDVNVSSNQSQVPVNESIDSQVLITNEPFITINSPQNNSVYFRGSILYANLTSDDPLTFAGYYLNGNSSDVVALNSISPTQWENVINTSLSGFYNITFLYNTSTRNFSLTPLFYTILNASYDMNVRKEVTNLNANLYFVQIFVENTLNVTKNITLLDFVSDEFIAGSFSSPGPSIINTTTGTLSGRVYGWNFTMINVSSVQVNYSISGVGDYNLGDNFLIGLE